MAARVQAREPCCGSCSRRLRCRCPGSVSPQLRLVVRVQDVDVTGRGLDRQPEQAAVPEVLDLGAEVGEHRRRRVVDAVERVDDARLRGHEHAAVRREPHTVGLPSPLQTVVSVKPLGRLVARLGATGAPNGAAEAGEAKTATSRAASRKALSTQRTLGTPVREPIERPATGTAPTFGESGIVRLPSFLADGSRARTVIAVRRPSAAMLVALLALFVALGGPAQAKHLINGKDIRKGTVASKQIKDRSITERDLEPVDGAARCRPRRTARSGASKLVPGARRRLGDRRRRGLDGGHRGRHRRRDGHRRQRDRRRQARRQRGHRRQDRRRDADDGGHRPLQRRLPDPRRGPRARSRRTSAGAASRAGSRPSSPAPTSPRTRCWSCPRSSFNGQIFSFNYRTSAPNASDPSAASRFVLTLCNRTDTDATPPSIAFSYIVFDLPSRLGVGAGHALGARRGSRRRTARRARAAGTAGRARRAPRGRARAGSAPRRRRGSDLPGEPNSRSIARSTSRCPP